MLGNLSKGSQEEYRLASQPSNTLTKTDDESEEPQNSFTAEEEEDNSQSNAEVEGTRQ